MSAPSPSDTPDVRRVGVDYLPAVSHAPGVGRYARELVRALCALEDGPALWLHEVGTAARTIGEPALGLEGSAAQRAGRLTRTVRRTPLKVQRLLAHCGLDPIRRQAPDLFHRVLPEQAPGGGATASTVALSELPEPGSVRERALTGLLARGADVLVFSADYAARVRDRYGLAPDRVHRVSVGCDHWVRDLAGGTPDEGPPRLLALGAVRPARRPVVVLSAFESLRTGHPDLELWIVGRRPPDAGAFVRALERSPARAAVRWIDAPREADMPRIVAGSRVLVHLTEDEGTAVTPLEALALGVPVAASRVPAFEEALAEAPGVALLANTDLDAAPRLLADAVDDLLAAGPDPGRRAHAAPFTWARNARETCAAWERTLRRRGEH